MLHWSCSGVLYTNKKKEIDKKSAPPSKFNLNLFNIWKVLKQKATILRNNLVGFKVMFLLALNIARLPSQSEKSYFLISGSVFVVDYDNIYHCAQHCVVEKNQHKSSAQVIELKGIA